VSDSFDAIHVNLRKKMPVQRRMALAKAMFMSKKICFEALNGCLFTRCRFSAFLRRTSFGDKLRSAASRAVLFRSA
jgi:hypothetical protein